MEAPLPEEHEGPPWQQQEQQLPLAQQQERSCLG